MNKYLQRIINRGIKDNDAMEVRRQVGLLNMASLLCFTTASLFIVLNIIQHNWVLLVNNLILCVLTTCLLFIRRFKFFNVSIIILVSLFTIYFSINALLFHNSLEYAILVMMVISVLLIDSKTWRIIMLALQISLFMVFILNQHRPPVIPPIPLYRNYVTVLAMMLIFACILQYFKRKQLKYLKNLSTLNNELLESNRVKERMLSILSHDFNAPVANLVTTLNMLDAKILTPREFDDVSIKLKAQLLVLTASLGDVLHWSKMQISGDAGQPAVIYLRELAMDILPLFQYSIEDKKLALENRLTDKSTAYANKDHLKLIFRNLLSNAIKFSHPGGRILIDIQETGGRVYISVQDEGTGITPAILQALQKEELTFNSTAGTWKERGTGLGLLLVREFLQKNNGSLSIQSDVGKGSTFIVSLPAEDEG